MKYINKEHIYWIREVGHFNYAEPKETQANYSFHFPGLTFPQINDLGVRKNFTVDEEKDNFGYKIDDKSTALEVAQYIYNIYKTEYFWHGGEKDILKLIEYLESQEKNQKILRLKYDIDYARAKMLEWNGILEDKTDEYIDLLEETIEDMEEENNEAEI